MLSLERDDAAATIVRAIIGLGHGLRLPITAEGVETRSQFDFLQGENCTEVQGYFVGRPEPITAYSNTSVREEPSFADLAA